MASIARPNASSSTTTSSSQLPIQLARFRLVEPDARPAPVGHRGLGVEHGAVPLEDADAGLQQRAVAGARDGLHQREVAAAPGHEQPHVDAVPRRRAQRLHVAGRAREVGVGEPQRAAGERGHQRVEPVEAGGARASVATTRTATSPAGAERLGRRQLLVGQRLAARRPGLGEGPRDVGHRGAADLDAGVAPAGAGRAPAQPSHALPTQSPVTKATCAVDHEALAVVAAQPARAARRGAAG